MEQNNNPLDSEIKELAEEVREHYPWHPESAFSYFRLKYPDIVSATMVGIIWNYFEFEQMMKTGMKLTRPMEKHDLQIFKSPFLLN